MLVLMSIVLVYGVKWLEIFVEEVCGVKVLHQQLLVVVLAAMGGVDRGDWLKLHLNDKYSIRKRNKECLILEAY
jgi:hypothetical protein